jgi:hypothetical protein
VYDEAYNMFLLCKIIYEKILMCWHGVPVIWWKLWSTQKLYRNQQLPLKTTSCININCTVSFLGNLNISVVWQHEFIFTGNTKCWKQKTLIFLLALKMNHTFLMLLRALFFGIFCFCVCEFFYFLIRSEGAYNATFICCTVIGQHHFWKKKLNICMILY